MLRHGSNFVMTNIITEDDAAKNPIIFWEQSVEITRILLKIQADIINGVCEVEEVVEDNKTRLRLSEHYCKECGFPDAICTNDGI